MQINHTFYNVVSDRNLLHLAEFPSFFMKLIKKTSVLKILRDQSIFICCDANTHVQDYVWMLKIAYYL